MDQRRNDGLGLSFPPVIWDMVKMQYSSEDLLERLAFRWDQFSLIFFFGTKALIYSINLEYDQKDCGETKWFSSLQKNTLKTFK